ncbi:MAG: hypothetical protein N3A38_01600 [Planctomycetota bacterium]|nr:hypothetical protein [Planctomycetota bacterium]
MRWTIRLASPTIVAGGNPPPRTPEEVASRPVLRLGPDAEGRRAMAWIGIAGDAIEMAVLAEGAKGAKPGADHPEWYYRAHALLMLNPGHDHAVRRVYAVDDRGVVERSAEWIAPGEEPGEFPSCALPTPGGGAGEFRWLDCHRFFARLRVPAGDALPGPGAPVGIRIKVGFSEEYIPEPLAWPPPAGEWVGDAPLAFGDLYAAPPPFAVEEIEFIEPRWGAGDDETSDVRLRFAMPAGARAEGLARTEIVLPDEGVAGVREVSWSHDGSGRGTVVLPVLFPHRAKWSNDLLKTAHLSITVKVAGGEKLWTAGYPFGFDCGIIARELYGRGSRPLPPRPSPDDTDFVGKFRAYIYRRIPAYRLRTTADGAPSDFFLEDPEGAAHLDLSARDSLDRAAAMIASRFPDWRDALCAVAAWVHHPAVTRHSGVWSRVSGLASVRTLPRLGGCFCGDTARLCACLAEKVGSLLGVPLRGFSIGLRGHLATLVETPEGRVVIDGMMGMWFHSLDNARLATLEEMRADREVVGRMWYCPRAHGHEFFFGVTNQTIRQWKDGALEWPA